jgi:large repetitive protein
VDAGSNQRVYVGEQFTLSANSPSSGLDYTWTPATQLTAPTFATTNGQINTATTFTVRFKDSFGCENTDEVTVELRDELECLDASEGMTPNDDAINDTWTIDCLKYYPDNRVEIYNRWGQLVFKADNYSNDFAATNVPDGTYYYVIKIFGTSLKVNTYKGTLTIIR